jgi:hypothetical protein
MTAAADPVTIYILCLCDTEIPAVKAPIVDVECPNCCRLWQWHEAIELRKQSSGFGRQAVLGGK